MTGKYSFKFTLYDCIFIPISLFLFGAGCTLMWVDGFDVPFAYLIGLPVFCSILNIRNGLRRASKANQEGDANGVNAA